ncbi:hypothetical protein ACFXPW_00930 [Streptomyces goshikiensis]|uniref:hypothetical protein n=1 Tax=Streptomyces goshikiensis TaxID=1942 RepID=UPI003697E360
MTLPILLGVLLLGVLLLAGAGAALYARRGARPVRAAVTGVGVAVEAEEVDEAALKSRRAAEVVALGFVPEAELDTAHPAPVPAERTAVLAALADGDWEVGAAYLKAAGRDWEERWLRVRVLAGAAAGDDGWLRAWREAKPSHPALALVAADTAVVVAWNARGDGAAGDIAEERLRTFHDLLEEAKTAAREAQRVADPADPVPYMVEQSIGIGLGYPHEDYEELWARITARGPKVLTAHTHALQYWCLKWHGSHELALSFARESAAAGEPGELLTLLPLLAYFEQDAHDPELTAEVFYKAPEIREAVDAALADLAAADPDDPRAVRMRHMLAYLLFWQDRDAAAVEQFRHVDGHIGAPPWSYAASPRSRYVYARDWAVRVTALG